MINICFKRHVSAQNWLEDNFSSLFYHFPPDVRVSRMTCCFCVLCIVIYFPVPVQDDLSFCLFVFMYLFLCISKGDLYPLRPRCRRWPIVLPQILKSIENTFQTNFRWKFNSCFRKFLPSAKILKQYLQL